MYLGSDLEGCARHNDSHRCSSSCFADDISNLHTQGGLGCWGFIGFNS